MDRWVGEVVGAGAVIVPFTGPMTAFLPVFAVIVPFFGPMTAPEQQFG